MLRNILSTAVPELAAKHVDQVLTEGLEREGLSSDRITGWILHAGGREILAAIRQRVGLTRRRHAMQRGDTARLRQREQPVRVLRAAGRDQRAGARRVLVDVVIRRGVQLPRSPACRSSDSRPGKPVLRSERTAVCRARVGSAPEHAKKHSTGNPRRAPRRRSSRHSVAARSPQDQRVHGTPGDDGARPACGAAPPRSSSSSVRATARCCCESSRRLGRQAACARCSSIAVRR